MVPDLRWDLAVLSHGHHSNAEWIESRIEATCDLNLVRTVYEASIGVKDRMVEQSLVDWMRLMNEESSIGPFLVVDDLGRVRGEDESGVGASDMRHTTIVSHLVRSVDDHRARLRDLFELVPVRIRVNA